MSKNIIENMQLELFGGNCKRGISEQYINAEFNSDSSVHILSYRFANTETIGALKVILNVNGWSSIDYLALGHVNSDGVYEHIKVKHVIQRSDISIKFSKNDLMYLLQNQEEKQDKFDFDTLKIFIKGEPKDKQGILTLKSISLLDSGCSVLTEESFFMSQELESYLFEHMKKCFRDHEEKANVLLNECKYPMPGGILLEWPIYESEPLDLYQSATYRFSWHALHGTIALLIYARDNRSEEALSLAIRLVSNWLEKNYYSQSTDKKFAWYDHGTAERLMCFLMLLSFPNFSKLTLRFKHQLFDAISKHIDLLAHEGFYAYHQNHRYHNHAWFQDAALLLGGLSFQEATSSESWQKLAIIRLEDQIRKLIVRDGGYSIFVENSIGYHHGIQRICSFVGQLSSLSKIPNEIYGVSSELNLWTTFFKYPNGRMPAQGDTFRLPTQKGKSINRGVPYGKSEAIVLDKAGYAVIKGDFNNIPYMFSFFATSLSLTHKHEDDLSFTYFFDGIEWLVDPSFHSHEYQETVPNFLKSVWAHNTVAIDGENYERGVGKSSITSWSIDDSIQISATSKCYEVEHNRNILKSNDNESLIIEDIVSQQVNGCYQLFQLGEEVVCTITGNIVQLTHPDSKYTIEIEFCDPGELILASGLDESRKYNGVTGLTFMEFIERGVLVNKFLSSKSKFIISIRRGGL